MISLITLIRPLVIFLTLTLANICHAQGVLALFGKSPEHHHRLGDNETYQLTYIHNDIATLDNSWDVTLDLEVSANKWVDRYGGWWWSDHHPNENRSYHPQWHNDSYGISITPVFRIPLYQPTTDWLLQLGIGIGISYQSNERFGYAKLGSRLLFENKLQLNLIYQNQHQVTLFLYHYSNGETNKYNDGVDTLGIGYGYHW
ncbi:acyloxyacyl hydrolase [Thalassotalea maritima]|uniref:acyloxyacyl hydrolase n=1 Tax=Thalassotalea maritima TaxID=3242416 RepID=UPI0035292BBC